MCAYVRQLKNISRVCGNSNFLQQATTKEADYVPMGLKGTGSYFQQQMCNIIGSDLLYNGVEVYLDDIIVYGATEVEYLANLRALLQKFADNGVRLSPRKCRFGLREVEYVGHVINSTGRTFSDKKKLKC
jgi:hypothetical protein